MSEKRECNVTCTHYQYERAGNHRLDACCDLGHSTPEAVPPVGKLWHSGLACWEGHATQVSGERKHDEGFTRRARTMAPSCEADSKALNAGGGWDNMLMYGDKPYRKSVAYVRIEVDARTEDEAQDIIQEVLDPAVDGSAISYQFASVTMRREVDDEDGDNR